MATIALNFEDGVTRFIDCLPHETVAEAAYRLGVNIPLDCADGACGTCKCKNISGTFDPGFYIEEALTEEEASQGYALACQMRPESDLVIEILASSTACKVQVATLNATILEVEALSKEVYRLLVKPEQNTAIEFLPGQYANFELPGHPDTTRSYSFSSEPGSLENEFLIRLVQGGLMSEFLKNEARPGQTLKMTAPLGSFYLREIKRPVLMFAGGTGIAPFLSMLEKLEKEGTTETIRLYYGVSFDSNLVAMDRLDKFTKELPFEYKACVADSASNHENKGYVTQWISPAELPDVEYDIYICGPPPMVDAVKATLNEQGIRFANFYLEKFVPSGTVTAE